MDSVKLRRLLQQGPDAPVAGQRCTPLPSGSPCREYCVTRCYRRASSPLCADLSFRYAQDFYAEPIHFTTAAHARPSRLQASPKGIFGWFRNGGSVQHICDGFFLRMRPITIRSAPTDFADGCGVRALRSTARQAGCDPRPQRPTSPVSPDMIFGKDNLRFRHRGGPGFARAKMRRPRPALPRQKRCNNIG